MSILRNILNFYLNSSIHVSLAVVSLAVVSYLEYGLKPDAELLLFIFLGTITGYNFVKYARVAKLHHASLARNLRLIQIFSFFCFAILVYVIFMQDIWVLGVSALFALLTLLYAVPVFRGKRNLRSLTGIKIFIIAVVWGGVSVILPLLDQSEISLSDKVIMFFQRLFFVLVITLPFEIRDLDFDAPGLGTIPQQFGVTRTKVLGLALLASILLLEYFKSNYDGTTLIALMLILGITAGFLIKSGKDQGKYFSSFWVEGIPLLWLAILFLLRIFPWP